MGLNPFRAQRRRPSDLVFVVAGLAVAVALVLWALFG
jgi:cytochrome c-type biogenesis protein CcmE